jgi:hypothetical protein
LPNFGISNPTFGGQAVPIPNYGNYGGGQVVNVPDYGNYGPANGGQGSTDYGNGDLIGEPNGDSCPRVSPSLLNRVIPVRLLVILDYLAARNFGVAGAETLVRQAIAQANTVLAKLPFKYRLDVGRLLVLSR